MKRLLLALVMSFYALVGYAALPDSSPTAHTAQLELLSKLSADGYMTAASAAEASKRYLVGEDKLLAATSQESSWTKYLSFVNLIKILAVVLLLVAFSGVIHNIVTWAWKVITLVPTYAYQGLFLAGTLLGTLAPQLIWASQGFYVALFCAFANLLIVGWMLQTYPQLALFFKRLFSLGVPPYVVSSFYTMLYFAALAMTYNSQVFGFFAAVSFSAMFGFGMFYVPGTLYLDVKSKSMSALIFSHTGALLLYAFASAFAVPHLNLFAAGFEYYCSIGLGLALLIGCSPWYNRKELNVLALTIILLLANISFACGFKSIGSVIDIFGVLIISEWILYIGFHGGLIIGTFATGSLLYGAAMFLESHGSQVLKALGA